MFENRPYQERIITKTIKAYNDGLISSLIESPTGSGKTIMALSIAKEMERQGYSVGWVALRRNLLAQAERENQEKGFNIKNIKYISLFSNDLPKDVDFLVLDECHHQACGTCVTLLNVMKPKKFLGMTATPWRTDRMQLSFQKVVKDAGIHILIEEGFLSPYIHFVMPEYTPASVAKLYAEEKERWGKTVVFFLKKEECYECQILLRDVYGIQSEVVTGETDRETQLDRFERGEISVVLNVFILTEGFDCPDLKTVFVRPSCKAPTIQMGGRVFRKHPTKQFAQIVQSRDAEFAFPDHARALEQFTMQDGKWYSVKGNENVAIAHRRVLQAIANSADVKLPASLTKDARIIRRRGMRGLLRASMNQNASRRARPLNRVRALPPGFGDGA